MRYASYGKSEGEMFQLGQILLLDGEADMSEPSWAEPDACAASNHLRRSLVQ